MRAYFGLVVLLFMIGFLVMPSVQVSSSNSAGVGQQINRADTQKKRGDFAPSDVSLTITVDSTSDGGGDCLSPGTCNLRAAIALANSSPGFDVITFNIGGGGQATITLGDGLPAITESVLIDGSTQPGYAGTPLIEIDGLTAGGSDGLTFELGSAPSEVRGLAINRFGGDGIEIRGDNCTISGNYIGVGLDGVTDRGNGGSGVRIRSTFAPIAQGADDFRTAVASENLIGGETPADGNVIAFNDGDGITVGEGTGIESTDTITDNSIFDNGGLGIDLNDDGVTPNDNCDVDTGANDSQNFPVLTSAVTDGANINIQGTLGTVSSNSAMYRIRFYASPSGDPSLHGEGQTPLGFIDVTSELDCEVSFNANLAVPVAGGAFITATATNLLSFNTSEFSQWVQATTGACQITCPDNVSVTNDPNLCSAVVNYPLAIATGCPSPTVTCTPPPGSVFQRGTTIVNCQVNPSTTCSFTVTVVDQQPPILSCPSNITTQIEIGQQSKVVQYPFPTAGDNCGTIFAIGCSPPSGSLFPAGTTTVTCLAADEAGNSATCLFTVSVIDPRPPVITCPANINVQSNVQCVSVVNYTAPVVSGTTGAVVTCTPPSGTTFTVGTTTVSCAAVSTTGLRVTCSFNVTVTALISLRITTEGNATPLDFGEGQAFRRTDPNPTSRTFMIENTGCGALNLNQSVVRTGSDVTSGKITNTDDSETFTISIVNANGTETPVRCEVTTGSCINIAPGQRRTFRVRFNRVIPPYAGKTTGLAAREVLPDVVTSNIVFTQGTQSFFIPLVGRVSPAVQLTNPSKTKKAPKVRFERAGNEYVVTLGFHDANLNTTRVKYELLGNNGQVVETVEVDISPQISALNPVRGQALRVEQRFSGANDNPNITGVRVTVTDAEGSSTLSTARSVSSSAASTSTLARTREGVFRPARVRINP